MESKEGPIAEEQPEPIESEPEPETSFAAPAPEAESPDGERPRKEDSDSFWNAFSTPLKVAFIAIAATVLGALGTWVDIGLARFQGYQGDGWFIAIPAGIALAMLGFQNKPKLWGVFLLMAFAAVFSFWKINEMTGIEMFGEQIGFAVMSWGLPMAAAGSIVAMVAVGMEMSR